MSKDRSTRNKGVTVRVRYSARIRERNGMSAIDSRPSI